MTSGKWGGDPELNRRTRQARRAWDNALRWMRIKDRLVASGVDTAGVDAELADASRTVDEMERRLWDYAGRPVIALDNSGVDNGTI